MVSLAPLSLLCVLSLFLVPSATSLTCSTQQLTNNKLFASCLDLPSLNSYLHFTYDAANSSTSIAFVSSPAKPSGWVSWAINPTATGMVGSQALIAFKGSAGAVTVKTYNVTSYRPLEESNSKISFEVWDVAAEDVGGVMRLYAKMKVPGDPTKVNQVWQVGPSVTDGVPDMHDMQGANMKSKGTLNFVAGQSSTVAGGGDESRSKNKNIHGILNAVSWGIMFPLGVVIARYLRIFPSADPAWFYLHVFCQSSAYVVGVAGWGTGLKLGSESKGIVYSTHRNLGIALFCLATVQMFAMLIRPNKNHKYRFYWNIYHHGTGYAIITLGIINVFKGLDILQPREKWRSAYVVPLVVLGGVAVFLEIVTWMVVLKRRSGKSSKLHNGYDNNGERRQEMMAL